jgi:Tol biopolymer transport system component
MGLNPRSLDVNDPSHAEVVFFAALEKATLAERAAYLDEACAGNEALRRRVEALLAAHPHVGKFLERPVVQAEAMAASCGLDDAAADLSFLSPPSEANSLGRLGHYEVLEVLGRGGFATVVRAFDENLQRVVAIKVLSSQMAVTSPARKRFLREARAAAAVRDDHVVQIYAVEEQPRPYLVMEYIPGKTLQQMLDTTGPLETSEMVRLALQIARGLAAAHAQGLIHRDIKPSNILLEQGSETKVKLTDFGLARAADDASLTQSGVVAGTPLYMAPEQAQGDHIDHRTDLFSLGSVLYVMLTGRPPFRAPSALAVLKRVCEDTPRPIGDIIPEAPAWLCDLIGKLHAKKPEDRFQTAREVADLLAQPPVETGTKGQVPHAARPRRLKRLAAGVLLLAAGLALGLTAKPLTNLAASILGRNEGVPAGGAEVEGPPVPPDATEPKFKKSLVGHTHGVFSVAYSPNGQSLASGDDAGEVRVWNLPDGTPRYVLPAREPSVHALAFSPDGKSLLTAAVHGNGSINIWDAETGKPDGTLKGHTNGLFEVSFGPDGKTLVSGGWDATIRVWDFAGRRESQMIPAPEGQWIRSVVVSASGRIAVGSGEKVFLLEPDGQLVKTFDTFAGPLRFSPDGRLLAGTTWREGRVTVWDINTCEQVAAWQAHEGEANGVAFSGDGRVLATAGGDGAVRLWDVSTQHQQAELRHEGHAYQLAFSPDGAALATTGRGDRLVKLWDVSFLCAPKSPGKNN